MTGFKPKAWKEFRQTLHKYVKESRERREQLVFRGHADAEWDLLTSLDRERSFSSDKERESFVAALADEFRREAIRLGSDANQLPAGQELDLLARHHGLPSPLLDLTGSPYVAAFFAYSFKQRPKSGRVAVWGIDRARLPAAAASLIEFVDDIELVRFNQRALRQRGQFLRVNTSKPKLTNLLDTALAKWELLAEDQPTALAELDEMGVNATTLFGDLDGAARTAWLRHTMT